MKSKLLHITFLLIVFSVSYAQEVELKTSISKNKLGLNQRLRIQFSINKQGADNFTPPNFKNFRVIAGPSQSLSQSKMNPYPPESSLAPESMTATQCRFPRGLQRKPPTLLDIWP